MAVTPQQKTSRLTNGVQMKHLRLRRSDACAVCSRALGQGTDAWWDAAARTVTCEDCYVSPTPPETVPTDEPLERGQAGASAAREHERRRDHREQRTRERHPRVGGLLLLLRDAPQHETAWQRGAAGERAVAESLEQRVSDGSVVLLHDRRIPRSRANIDHLAVAPSGVYVIDAKNYTGKFRVERPWFGALQWSSAWPRATRYGSTRAGSPARTRPVACIELGTASWCSNRGAGGVEYSG